MKASDRRRPTSVSRFAHQSRQNRFVGPAALPAALRERLSAAILRIVQRPETVERIRAGGATVCTQDSAQFAALIRAELDNWGTVIRAAGLKLE